MIEILQHQWKQFRRSGSFGREIGFTIFLGIIAILVLTMVLGLSSILSELIPTISENAKASPTAFFCRLLLYYFGTELFMRYFLQNVPALDIQPYLLLPIKKSLIVRFLIGKSFLHPINVISLILVIPFSINTIAPTYGYLASNLFVLAVFTTSLILHLFNILFKKKLEENIWVWIIIITAFALNYLASQLGVFDITTSFGELYLGILNEPIWVLAPIGLFSIGLIITKKVFEQNLYLEELIATDHNSSEKYSSKLLFLTSYGINGQLLLEEIRMIIRHKRTRSVLLLSIIFLGYGFLSFGRENSEGINGLQLFVGIFISGIFAINYGQFTWSWHTNQMDFLFTKPIALTDWVKSRYMLISLATISSTILAIPYVYFGWEILLVLIASGIYNLGINIPLMIRLSLWGPKPIDLNKGAFMNYQGTGAAQWLMGLPVLLGPFLIYFPLSYFFNHLIGILGVAFIGLIGLLFRNYFIHKTAQKLGSLKYQLIHHLTL